LPIESAKRIGSRYVSGRTRAWLKTKKPELSAQLVAPIISNAELDRLIADLGTNPLAKGELRQVRQGVYVSLSQSQPENLDFAFCLSSGGRMYFFFRKAE
jgi:hypothetical protein